MRYKQTNKKEQTMNIDLGTNEQGDALSARIINQGDNYGLNDCLTHNEVNPMIEFYYAATEENPAYFISRYYLTTLNGTCTILPNLTPATQTGVCLCGSMRVAATAKQVQLACDAA